MNSNIIYRIRTTEARKLFELNPVTGELKVLYTLDFEKLSPEETMHTFVVEAVDSSGSMPPGLATVTVMITVSSYSQSAHTEYPFHKLSTVRLYRI